jgi:hypothetical protein
MADTDWLGRNVLDGTLVVAKKVGAAGGGSSSEPIRGCNG